MCLRPTQGLLGVMAGVLTPAAARRRPAAWHAPTCTALMNLILSGDAGQLGKPGLRYAWALLERYAPPANSQQPAAAASCDPNVELSLTYAVQLIGWTASESERAGWRRGAAAPVLRQCRSGTAHGAVLCRRRRFAHPCRTLSPARLPACLCRCLGVASPPAVRGRGGPRPPALPACLRRHDGWKA